MDTRRATGLAAFKQHFLNFLPLRHGHGSFPPVFIPYYRTKRPSPFTGEIMLGFHLCPESKVAWPHFWTHYSGHTILDTLKYTNNINCFW